MTNLSPENVFIMDLFNLHTQDVKLIHYYSAQNVSHFEITLAPKYDPCPSCGFKHPKIKNYVLKKVNHSYFSNHPCLLEYHARRYVCPICHRTYYEHNPFVFKNQKISTLTIMNCLNDLKDFNETFTSVARRHHLSPTSVCSIFDSHVQVSRKKLPKVINFDEVYAFRSKDSKYVCVLLDFIKQVPIDILPSRRYDYLDAYFEQIPAEEKANVSLICSDMYDTYRSIAQKHFPNCRCAVDVFHVSQEFHRKLSAVRIRIMKGCTKSNDDYYILKKFNWLLFKDETAKDKDGNPLFDINAPRIYNHHYKQHMNYYDLRKKLLEVSDDLVEVYNLKLTLNQFYRENSINIAREALETLIIEFLHSQIPEMQMFARTLIKWKEEIINSFLIVNHEFRIKKDDGTLAVLDKKINNAIIENRNKVIKCIKHNANGYTNWKRFRNRVLYVLDPKERYHLEPIEEENK